MRYEYDGKVYDLPDDTTIQQVNEYFGFGDKAKQKKMTPEDFISQTGVNRTSFDTLRDLAAGGARGMQNLASTLGEAGQGLGKLAEPLRKYIPESLKIFPDVDIREEMGLGNKNPVDIGSYLEGKNPNRFVQGIGQYAPGVAMGGASMPGQMASNALWEATQASPDEKNLSGLLPSGRTGAAIEGATLGAIPGVVSKSISYIKPATKKGIQNTILETHDAINKRASEGFQQVSGEVEKRGIRFGRMPGLSQDLSEYFPKTRAAGKLLNDAESGSYDALRKVQSELYKKGNKNLASDFESENLRGEEMLEKRNDIIDAISERLKETGNTDLDSILNNSRNDWQTIKDIYYNPQMETKAIRKMVSSGKRLSPKDITKVLEEESEPMTALKEFHPGLEEALKRHGRISSISEKVRKYAIPAGIGALGGIAGTSYMKR